MAHFLHLGESFLVVPGFWARSRRRARAIAPASMDRHVPGTVHRREEVILTSSHPFPKGAPQEVYGTTAIFSGGTAIATAATATTRRRTATTAAARVRPCDFPKFFGSRFGSHLLVFARATVIFSSPIAYRVWCDECAHVRSTCVKLKCSYFSATVIFLCCLLVCVGARVRVRRS